MQNGKATHVLQSIIDHADMEMFARTPDQTLKRARGSFRARYPLMQLDDDVRSAQAVKQSVVEQVKFSAFNVTQDDRIAEREARI